MKTMFTRLVCSAALACFSVLLLSWGTWGHQHINHAAVFALPEEMRHFFYNHIDFITEESVIPDVRKYTINDKAEFNRHYIDLESYQPSGGMDSLPRTMPDLTARYDAKFLNDNGILPWYIVEMMDKLTKAMKEKRKGEILFLAADLGHYLGDANMPLHTSVNHDGQLSGQRGIHSFFESELPEMFGEKYNFYTGDAVYIQDIHAEVWRIIGASHQLADSLFATEKQVHAAAAPDKMFKKDAAGAVIKNKFNQQEHTTEYAASWHNALNGIVERQLRAAVRATANFWYTAWVNAGKPNLDELDVPELTSRNRKNFKKDYSSWQKGKLFGFKIDREY